MIKILLTSDLHLGLGKDNENSPVPDSSRFRTLKKLAYLARSHDLFLIAGDLFHLTGLNDETMDIVRKEFDDLRRSGVEIIITTGEQETNKNGGDFVLSSINASKVFYDGDKLIPYKYSKDNQDVFIYGLPAYSKYNISGIKRVSVNGFHIGLFHADFNFHEPKRKSEIITIGKKDIISSNLDFYALGHHHQFQLFKSNVQYIGAYPGSPEPASLEEKGDRYALSVIVKDNEIFQIKRLTVNTTYVEHLTFDCSNTDYESIINAIKEQESGNKILKITFTGKRDFRLNINEIIEPNKFQGVHIEDRSYAGIGVFIDEFSGEETIRGEFFNILNEKMEVEDFVKIDRDVLCDVLSKIIYSGANTLEDVCSYWNV